MSTEKSLIEAATIILQNEKHPVNLYDLFDRVSADAGLTEEEKQEAITKFYTDLTVSAKFVYIGNNEFNLKSNEKIELWEKDGSFYKEYSVVEIPEEYKEKPKPKVKAEPKEEVIVVEEEQQIAKPVEVIEQAEEVEASPVLEPVTSDEDSTDEYEEDVFEEYDEFDEEKYNEYMDTYEDQYED
jgi:DNA-directed RNA polymerase subunit delta